MSDINFSQSYVEVKFSKNGIIPVLLPQDATTTPHFIADSWRTLSVDTGVQFNIYVSTVNTPAHVKIRTTEEVNRGVKPSFDSLIQVGYTPVEWAGAAWGFRLKNAVLKSAVRSGP